MTPPRKLVLLALAVALPLAACAQPPASNAPQSAASCPACPACAPGSPAAAADANEVVATIGSESITRADLEKSVKAQLIEVDNQRYEILEEGLNNLVSERLLTMEAKAKGKSVQEFQQELLSAPVPEPTDADVQKIYDENKEQLGGKSLDEVKGRIVEYLKNQARAQRAQALLTELRAKNPTSIKLVPPMVDVSAAGREARGGGDSAPIQIIAFSDYECPFCKKAEETVDEVMKAYGNKVNYVHRDYPLPFHKEARPAAEAARCAGEQGKFWEVHDALFKAAKLDEASIAAAVSAAGVDKAKYDDCIKSGRAGTKVDEDMEAGSEVGVSGTPAFFINGRMLSGAQPFDRFKAVIDAELAKAGSK